MELTHEKYELKIVECNVMKNVMSRHDVMLESIEKSSLSYHTRAQVRDSLKSLTDQYPDIVHSYYHGTELECVKIGSNISNSEVIRPPVRVVGWSQVGTEIALNLAQFLITRLGRDDMITDLASKFEIHIGFGSQLKLSETSSDSSCPEQSFHQNSALKSAVDSWDEKTNFLFGINLVAGTKDLLVDKSSPGHYLGQVYLSLLHQKSHIDQCEGVGATQIRTVGGRSKEIQVGLSCCDRPETLGSIWDSHKKSILAVLMSLQGVHGELVEDGDRIVNFEKLMIKLNSSETIETSK